jgi:type II secretory pathway component GspD/PulD (secretin)
MKTKLTALALALAACHLAGFAQETPAPPPVVTPAANPQPAVAPEPATPAQLDATAPAPVEVSPPVNPNEQVPLIVIDDVPLTDAIRNLARQSGLNFQFDPRVTATNQPNISIRFEDVTPQEALDAVLENHGMRLVKDPRSRIGRITYRDAAAEEPLVARIIQLKYSDPTNLISIVKSTLSPRSQVVADPRTSQLIVSTTEREMDGLTNLIASLDLPTRQVLIEAKLIETSHAPSTLKGINWSGTFENQRFELGNNADRNQPIPLANVLSSPRVVLNSAAGFAPPLAFLNADGVSAVFQFFNKDSDSEVIATPRAVTLDNQMAILSVTRAYPIFQITPGSANSPAGSTIVYTNLGTILQVTPRIAADDNVSMRVVPEVSNIDGKDAQVINGEDNIANIYAIRRIEANVMIPSGHTLVMGGLISDRTTKSNTKVPILGDIPGAGWFFRTKGKERNKGNLLIFVTPTIVDGEDYMVNPVGRDFLKTRYSEKVEPVETAWDSAKPHDWTKPVY